MAMYHAHHHGQMQVPNGLFGTFMVGEVAMPVGQTISGVEIPTDLQVAQEIPMVLNDAGVIGLSLNGKSFPATQPYTGKVGIGSSSITTTRGCRSTRCISINSVSWSTPRTASRWTTLIG